MSANAAPEPAHPGRQPRLLGHHRRGQEAELWTWTQRVDETIHDEAVRVAETLARSHTELAELRDEAAAAARRVAAAEQELARLRQAVVETEETVLLQRAGVYRYRHPLSDAVGYRAQLARIQDAIGQLVNEGGAVEAATGWTLNGSGDQGLRLITDVARLALRTYNAEAEACLRAMEPHRLTSALERLDAAREAVDRLGWAMRVRISDTYHRLCREELTLTADYLAKVDEERERVGAEQRRRAETAGELGDFEHETVRLVTEQSQHAVELARLLAVGDEAGAVTVRARLDRATTALAELAERRANSRAGYLYVLSNVGAFGPDVVRIGLTRRLDPLDRVRDLDNGSVPFPFDWHALVYATDAITLYAEVTERLADRVVNRTAPERGFYRATPGEVRRLLAEVVDGQLVEYREEPEAAQWRASSERTDPSTGQPEPG